MESVLLGQLLVIWKPSDFCLRQTAEDLCASRRDWSNICSVFYTNIK